MFPIANGGQTPYSISKSMRFRSGSLAYMQRTPAVASSSRKVFTFSCWLKRGTLGTNQVIFGAAPGTTDTDYWLAYITANNQVYVQAANGGTLKAQLNTQAVLRDTNAWYNVVIAFDALNTVCRIYLNGTEASTTITTAVVNEDGYVGFTIPHRIGRDMRSTLNTTYFDGYMADITFVDGFARDASFFGQFDDNGVWVPKRYESTFGTNGYALRFNNGTSTTTLGNDSAGTNNWTLTNFSLTAGPTYDWMNDSPSNNYAVLDRLTPAPLSTISDGNLRTLTTTTEVGGSNGSMAMRTGKWYWEVTSASNNNVSMLGIRSADAAMTTYPGGNVDGYGYYQNNGNKYNNGTSTAYGTSWSSGTVIGVAFDADIGSLTFYRNGVSQGVAFTSIPGNYWLPAHGDGSASIATSDVFNFGQQPFVYTPPSGFNALCSNNLPALAVKPKDNFAAILGSGANIKALMEAVFPGAYLAMNKDRANVNNNQWIDNVRGTNAVLRCNTTDAETTYTAPSGNSVAHVFKSGGSPVTNNAGSISSQVSANVAAGISIVTYNGNNAISTVGHGLGSVPQVMFLKCRSAPAAAWRIYAAALGNQAYLAFDSALAGASTQLWNATNPTSTVFTIGPSTTINVSGGQQIAYCFAPKLGFSKFGVYNGNALADGPYIHCGFLPAFVMIKRHNVASSNWFVYDSTRDTRNSAGANTYWDSTAAEVFVADSIDFLSTGFKIRRVSAGMNTTASASQYLYMAFAKNPFGGLGINPTTAF